MMILQNIWSKRSKQKLIQNYTNMTWVDLCDHIMHYTLKSRKLKIGYALISDVSSVQLGNMTYFPYV